MGSSRGAGAGGVGQKPSVVLGDAAVVVDHGNYGQDLVEERPLRGLAAHIGSQVHTSEEFRDANRWNRDVRIVRQAGLATDSGDQHAGIEDYSLHGSASSSADAAVLAVVTFSLKPSSNASAPRHRAMTSFKAVPLAADAGVMAAIRRPPRVTTTVSPCSTESSRAEKLRDASDAVTSRMILILSDSDIQTRCMAMDHRATVSANHPRQTRMCRGHPCGCTTTARIYAFSPVVLCRRLRIVNSVHVST